VSGAVTYGWGMIPVTARTDASQALAGLVAHNQDVSATEVPDPTARSTMRLAPGAWGPRTPPTATRGPAAREAWRDLPPCR
jgi:hypothetical protein